MLTNARTTLLILGDIISLYLALVFTVLIRYGLKSIPESFSSHFYPFSIIFILWLIVFYIFDLYLPKAYKNRLQLARLWSGAILVGFLISIITFYVFGSFFQLTPKTNLIIFTILFGIIGFFWRVLYISFTKSRKWQTQIAIIGNSKNLEEALSTINNNPGHGYHSEFWIKDLSEINNKALLNKIQNEKIELIVIHPSILKNSNSVDNLSDLLLPSGIRLVSFTDFFEEIFRKAPLEDLDWAWFLENNSSNKFYTSTKRFFDFALALILLIVLSPLFIIISFLLKISSPGPIIFKQVRVGYRGKHFTLYKFRTMVQDAEKDGAKWAVKNDSRVTSLGKFLRHSHLDEIPQLWNILCGKLSFVGPRPERPEFTKDLRNDIPYYDMRNIVQPGLTGWAQVNYRYGASVEDAKEKLKYELYYIKNHSFVLDLLTILKTTRMIFKNH